MSRSKRLTVAAVLPLAAGAALAAQDVAAQPASQPLPATEPPPSEAHFGDYTVYFSAVPSDVVPDVVAREHDVPRGEDTMLLIVSVERDRMNLAAGVEARATNLAAQITDIEMQEVVGNGEVSYLGAFDVEYRSTIDFDIAVSVPGEPEPFTIEFREQFL